jgi:uncharacterized protein YaaN involved in tellurite resistance
MINRFEKKIYDLELTRTISVQMAPQIVLSRTTTVSWWRRSRALSPTPSPVEEPDGIGSRSPALSAGMEAQREVTNVTNELLKQNAEKLKTGSIDIARESERGIVEIETLKHTNEQLISTLEEVQSIQAEGRQKRAEAEVELVKIESELKEKLLNLRK